MGGAGGWWAPLVAGGETNKKLSQNLLLNGRKSLLYNELDRYSSVLRPGRFPTRTCDRSAGVLGGVLRRLKFGKLLVYKRLTA